ncbi:type VI secretion system amidase effector protein Tae4 [Burkholderia ubonensis]|uniref:type VI secretion system amidase effector protein Tae4 n=1 Tax=Burkholderia ubonensis TaxID=101571 RepID=UPI0009B4D6E8|nr:type VI secretion system amidase effector protein Tae4 [Burkholderia ubonensis]
MSRPSFSGAWHAFMKVRVSVKEVGKRIGGNVQKNIELPDGGFKNSCPIRMSYVLNATGFAIRKNTRYAMVSGGDKHQYIYRVADMVAYLESAFGKPDKTVRNPKPSDFANMKGIIAVKGHGWSNAIGHVTLWDGARCADSCHLSDDPDNGTFIPETASIWVLR